MQTACQMECMDRLFQCSEALASQEFVDVRFKTPGFTKIQAREDMIEMMGQLARRFFRTIPRDQIYYPLVLIC